MVDAKNFIYGEQVDPGKALLSKHRVRLKVEIRPWTRTFEQLIVGSSYLVQRWGLPTASVRIADQTYELNGVDLITDYGANRHKKSRVKELVAVDDGRGGCLVVKWPGIVAIFFQCATATICHFFVCSSRFDYAGRLI
jgi:hypothetical protein